MASGPGAGSLRVRATCGRDRAAETNGSQVSPAPAPGPVQCGLASRVCELRREPFCPSLGLTLNQVLRRLWRPGGQAPGGDYHLEEPSSRCEWSSSRCV